MLRQQQAILCADWRCLPIRRQTQISFGRCIRIASKADLERKFGLEVQKHACRYLRKGMRELNSPGTTGIAIRFERNTLKGKALYTNADKKIGSCLYWGRTMPINATSNFAAQQSIEKKELEASYRHILAKMDRVWSVNYD